MRGNFSPPIGSVSVPALYFEGSLATNSSRPGLPKNATALFVRAGRLEDNIGDRPANNSCGHPYDNWIITVATLQLDNFSSNIISSALNPPDRGSVPSQILT